MRKLITGAGLVDRLKALSVHELFFWRTRMKTLVHERGLIDEELEARGVCVHRLIGANLEERKRQFSFRSDFQGVMW